MIRWLAVSFVFVAVGAASAEEKPNHRRPADADELRFWLGNMVWHHRFTPAEIAEATGLSAEEIAAACSKFGIAPETKPKRPADAPLLVLPYPGGRHPRAGFRDGAVRPQRETKVSAFAPWPDGGYVVIDVPEAVWSDLGLTYLAHTHVPTVWTKANVELPPQEWDRWSGGTLAAERKLPNGIAFKVTVIPRRDSVEMAMTLTNGTKAPLSDLRVQMCAMLKEARGFAKATNDNKVFAPPYAAAKADDGDRWVIVAWEPCHRAWGNPPCPCLHSDPKFPDCPPGETRTVRGRLWFFAGADVRAEFRRLDRTGWREGK